MKKVLAILLALTVVFSLAAMAYAADNSVYRIMLTCSNTAGVPHIDECIKAIDRIAERTDNKVVIEFHGGGEMLVDDEGIEAVMSNTAVMYLTDASTFADYVPAYATITAPFLFSEYEAVEKFVQADLWKSVEAEAEEAGLHSVVNDFVLGTRNILAPFPVYTKEDCAALNIRVPGNTLYTSIFEALGTNYLTMSVSDMVSAMETGMCNSMEGTSATISKGYYESIDTPHYTLNGHLMSVIGIHTGAGFWNSLPEEYRQIITEEFENAAHEANKIYAANFQSDLEFLKSEGVTIVELTPEEKQMYVDACAPVAEKLPMYAEFKAAIA